MGKLYIKNIFCDGVFYEKFMNNTGRTFNKIDKTL